MFCKVVLSVNNMIRKVHRAILINMREGPGGGSLIFKIFFPSSKIIVIKFPGIFINELGKINKIVPKKNKNLLVQLISFTHIFENHYVQGGD